MGETRAEPYVSLSSGDRFGPYEVIAPLGAGGMGEVYKAFDHRLRRDVALKIVSSRFAFDAARHARFARESQILASLNHPNIATLLGLKEERGLQALVLELVEGQTLEERLAGNLQAYIFRRLSASLSKWQPGSRPRTRAASSTVI